MKKLKFKKSDAARIVSDQFPDLIIERWEKLAAIRRRHVPVVIPVPVLVFKEDDSTRFFCIERVPAEKLAALLIATEKEGHQLIHQVADHVGLAYLFTVFFERKKPAAPAGTPFTIQ